MTPQHILLPPHVWVPNNPRLPVLVCRAAGQGAHDAAAWFETLFRGNGWPARWRDGVYEFHHYHSTAHEVLGIARGSARLTIGGPGGAWLDVAAGDVLVLPAGTCHRRIAASGDFLVVGTYPPEQDFDICCVAPSATTLARIAALPFPESDPVHGRGGPLTRLWQAADDDSDR